MKGCGNGMGVVSLFQFGLPHNGPDKRQAHENSINALQNANEYIRLDLSGLYSK